MQSQLKLHDIAKTNAGRRKQFKIQRAKIYTFYAAIYSF
jgi:hypothetical protein